MTTETAQSRYNGKRKQVAQIVCRTDIPEGETTSEYDVVMAAVEIIRNHRGGGSTREILLDCLMRSAKRIK